MTDVAKATEVFLDKIDSQVAAHFEACVHCGQCSQACLFYQATEDPKFTPVYKLQPLEKVYRRHKAPFSGLKRMLGLAPPELTASDLEDWAELVYDACTLCGRCTVVCPMGIDIASMVRKVREGFSAAGLVPDGLTGAAQRAIEIGSPLGIKPATLEKIVAEQAEEVGIPIQLNKVGADYLVILSAMEVLNFYEVISALARLFKKADVSWTISTDAYEATNVGIQMGNLDVAKTLVGRIVEAAEKLQVKYVISPECGHAYSALKWEGPNLVGRDYNFKVIHILELLDNLRREGRITFQGKDDRRLTYHDPCQIVRRGGIVKEPRDLLGQVASNFVEMEDHGIYNVCCGGGGGVSANARAEDMRLRAFASKKAQIDKMGEVDALVTSCANCRNVLEEGIEHYGMDLPVIGLSELLADYLTPEERGEPPEPA
ncbi:MAG: (Fe-S)-binding protein [Alphaproteobacteria bacterium]|jgi:Fe-S oxidoreductase|nr:(Fe-S)-binding protein [Alphaproteobacteria bacterium]MBT7944365.1 (Fe-S)-binding protein [Alphaproteobacteria bacterium]